MHEFLKVFHIPALLIDSNLRGQGEDIWEKDPVTLDLYDIYDSSNTPLCDTVNFKTSIYISDLETPPQRLDEDVKFLCSISAVVHTRNIREERGLSGNPYWKLPSAIDMNVCGSSLEFSVKVVDNDDLHKSVDVEFEDQTKKPRLLKSTRAITRKQALQD